MTIVRSPIVMRPSITCMPPKISTSAVPRIVIEVTTTENSDYAVIENRERKFFGLQFHPEVVHTPRGKELLANFVHGICGCGKNWTMRSYLEKSDNASGRTEELAKLSEAQLMEMAKNLSHGVPFATPVFDGATHVS